MDKNDKLLVIIVGFLTSTAIFGLRHQEPIVSIPSIIVLILLTILTGRVFPLVGMGTTLLFVYSAAQTGWLFMRGSHVAARLSHAISIYGWPLSQGTIEINRGFTETPFLHFITVITSEVAGVGILPTTTARPLAGNILSIVFGGSALLLTLITVRRYTHSNENLNFSQDYVYLTIPVLAWIPFFQARTVFARRSLGIVLFTGLIFSMYMFYSNQTRRVKIIILLFGISTVPSHHFISFITIVILAMYSIMYLLRTLRRSPLSKYNSLTQTAQLLGITVILSVIFFSWQYFATDAGITLIRILNGTGSLTEKYTSVLAFFTDTQQATELPPVSKDWFLRYQTFFGFWIYLAAVGGLAILSMIVCVRDRLNDDWLNFTVSVGVIIGMITFGSWLFSTGSVSRIATFYILVGGWCSLTGITILSRKRMIPPHSMKLVAVGVLILGISLVPPFIIGIGDTPYSQGKTDQRFPATYYAGGEFTERTDLEQPIIGDGNVEHILIGTTGQSARNLPGSVLTGKTPDRGAIILLDYNDQYYFGETVEFGSFKANPTKVHELISKNNKIYDNNDVTILT